MLKKIFLILWFTGFLFSAFSQEGTEKKILPVADLSGNNNENGANVLYRNEMSMGVLVHSNGYGAIYRRGYHVSGIKKRIIEVEFATMRHPKSIKTANPYFENSKGFYYGKLNNFGILRAGYSIQKTMYEKADGKGVQIRYIYTLGPSIGLAKPIYLEILKSTPIPLEFELSTEKYNPDIHFIEDIYGKAPSLKGLNETKIYPGAYVRFGLSFEYANSYNRIKAVELGFTADAYTKVVPIMAFAKNKQIFTSLYVNFLIGKRWF